MSEKEVTGYVNENALNQAKANLNANTSLAAVKEAEAIRVAMASVNVNQKCRFLSIWNVGFC